MAPFQSFKGLLCSASTARTKKRCSLFAVSSVQFCFFRPVFNNNNNIQWWKSGRRGYCFIIFSPSLGAFSAPLFLFLSTVHRWAMARRKFAYTHCWTIYARSLSLILLSANLNGLSLFLSPLHCILADGVHQSRLYNTKSSKERWLVIGFWWWEVDAKAEVDDDYYHWPNFKLQVCSKCIQNIVLSFFSSSSSKIFKVAQVVLQCWVKLGAKSLQAKEF